MDGWSFEISSGDWRSFAGQGCCVCTRSQFSSTAGCRSRPSEHPRWGGAALSRALALFLGLASFSGLFFNFFQLVTENQDSRLQRHTRVHTSRILSLLPAYPVPSPSPTKGWASFLVSFQGALGMYKHTYACVHMFFLLPPFPYTGLTLFYCVKNTYHEISPLNKFFMDCSLWVQCCTAQQVPRP